MAAAVVHPDVDDKTSPLAASHVEGQFTNRRQQKLFTVQYLPPGQTPLKAVLVFHHGLKEHILRHAEFTDYAAAGIAVHGFDVHSHGHSEPKDRALIWSYRHLVEDFCDFAADVAKRYPTTPMFVGGNSMGALVTALSSIKTQNTFRGLIMFSAAIDVEWTFVLRVLAPIGNVLATLIPKARVAPAVRIEDMSQDPAVLESILNDPLNDIGKVRARTANEIKKAMEEVRRQQRLLTLPVLAIHGTEDRCTSRKAVIAFLKGCQSKDQTMIEIQGGFHELTQGPERKEVIGHALKWMLERC